ncbi:hypothetical protein B0H11DRAFT_2192519 [Mycena galericulata]|nr:hypothetical protein B0H11DRAFT_2192519 [Mycena galericulata]
MPRELPGFYFDPDKNRYFPLASRPAAASLQNHTPNPTTDRNLDQLEAENGTRTSRRKERVLWDSRASLSRTLSAAARARAAESLLHARLAHTGMTPSSSRIQTHNRIWYAPAGTRVCAFTTTPWISDADADTDAAVESRQFAGDARGWVYSRVALNPPASHYEEYAYGDWAEEGWWEDDWGEWTPELCLHPESEVSAILTTPSRCVAVCFGPTTKIGVQDGGAPGRTSLLSLTSVRDVRAASLQGSALVLGAARHAVLLPDLDAAASAARVRTLSTGSDVFAVAQSETLIYAGTRAGAVLRFDTRVKTSAGGKAHGHAQTICESGAGWPGPDAHASGSRSTVVFVHPTREGRELVVGFMDGRLGTYDLRFVRPAAPPAVVYAGHVGAVAPRLGIALDPDERLLFAAGADCRVRAWALGSGAPVVPPSAVAHSDSSHGTDSEATQRNPFTARLAAPLAALQVVEDGPGPGVLWGGGGGELRRWRLGV